MAYSIIKASGIKKILVRQLYKTLSYFVIYKVRYVSVREDRIQPTIHQYIIESSLKAVKRSHPTANMVVTVLIHNFKSFLRLPFVPARLSPELRAVPTGKNLAVPKGERRIRLRYIWGNTL